MGKKSEHLYLTCLIEIGCWQKRQELLLGKIMTQVSELASKLDAINAQMSKAIGEVQAQLAALQEALVNAQLPPEAEAALNNLVAAVQVFDDLNPDAIDQAIAEPVTEPPVA